MKLNDGISASWMPGFESLHKADAQLVAEEIASIGESVTPVQIVEKARDSGTELHKCFEWRNDVAAEKYRLQQARQVVCHLVIRETIREDKPPVRLMFQVKNGDGYQPTQIIYRDPDKYQALLQSVLRDLVAIRNKHANLAELEQVFEAIDQLAKRKAS